MLLSSLCVYLQRPCILSHLVFLFSSRRSRICTWSLLLYVSLGNIYATLVCVCCSWIRMDTHNADQTVDHSTPSLYTIPHLTRTLCSYSLFLHSRAGDQGLSFDKTFSVVCNKILRNKKTIIIRVNCNSIEFLFKRCICYKLTFLPRLSQDAHSNHTRVTLLYQRAIKRAKRRGCLYI